MNKYLFALCVLWATTGAVEHAHAHTLMRCTTNVGTPTSTTTVVADAAKWNSTPQFRISTNDFTAAQRTGLTWAIGEWNRSPQARKMTHTTYPGGFAPGFNDVFVNEAACSDGCAYVFQSCSQGIIEADIAFKAAPPSAPNDTWTMSATKSLHWTYGGQFADLRSVALHEFGHAMGLAHTDNRYNLMGDSWRVSHTNGTLSYPYVAPDDVAGVIALYGVAAGAKNEVGVSHWRFDRDNGEYSLHAFSNALNSAGAVLPNTQHAGDTRSYTIRRGQVIRPQVFVENNGAGSVGSIPMRYTLQSSDGIDSSGGGIVTLRNVTASMPSRGNLLLKNESLTIPAGTAPGNYFIGVIVDVNEALVEEHDDPFDNPGIHAQTGNATYIPIRVTN